MHTHSTHTHAIQKRNSFLPSRHKKYTLYILGHQDLAAEFLISEHFLPQQSVISFCHFLETEERNQRKKWHSAPLTIFRIAINGDR